ncbi:MULTISPECIES: motility associated factor glycosyltransferase family protein [Paenibacillus]|uniref:6-hydroxymethylpterin diphosphokinase MptE-like domain-containing protein n=1 Tax=Paenibacillus pabuli TaxID=1472 RepID=A0A855XWH1_9BACL|nr:MULTISPECIES: 6-hydroxymethylpterin diphosphokinase MptE-like protein [Paenibacillus]PWW37442.1 hypothetical protein DET56_109329 [Paenibacillus pabuli]PXW05584.1 hypothetical protein DEU73_108328 [Paenibacillus taichungensis]RAI98880.1 hypothetical protein DET54_10317 [Paenibacillus pabuli]
MNFSSRNIKVLMQNADHWINSDFVSTSDDNLMIRDEHGNDYVVTGNAEILLKSDLDESGQPNPLKRELIFLVGITSVQEIEYIIRKMSEESFLIIIEPNPSFFNYALNNKDLSFFMRQNVMLFADELTNLPVFLDKLFSTTLIYYMRNIKFYFTYFYRTYDVNLCVDIVRSVKETVKYKAMIYGNSIDDSLKGFKHNMSNLPHLLRSKDVSQLKNRFKDVPAVIVAAGPSLNKNIKELKKVKGKSIIIAVDTIAQRLLVEGIIPDFICSIEREKETYTYFYENKNYPPETTIVAPLLLYPEIFNEFKGDLIIPIRENVGEYIWLNQVLGLEGDNSISIGLSCAHVAFGFAEHIGASPIILVGQDLAFGNSVEQSHAGGTIYDDSQFSSSVFSAIEKTVTEGYDGMPVPTTEIWNSFRKWFEIEIFNEGLNVINATEGGAKIAHTQQLSLRQVAERYCNDDILTVKKVMQEVSEYPLNRKQMDQVLNEQIEYFSNVKTKFEEQLKSIVRVKITKRSTKKELIRFLNKLSKTDPLFKIVTEDWLLRHNLQPILMSSFWNLYDIEQTLSYENLIRNREIQIEFLEVSIFVLNEINTVLKKSTELL